MTRAQLTDAQHDALRMLVEHARCRDHGLHLGRTTDANLREINGRVARRLAEHGLVEFRVDAEGRFHQVGDEVAHATEAGRAFILDPLDQAEAAMSAPAPPAAGLDDEARALLEEASRADAVEEDDSCDCSEHEDALGDDWHVDGCDGGPEDTGAGAIDDTEVPPAIDPAPDVDHTEVDDTYEGRPITAFESRILAAHRDAVRGSIPARHLGARIVAVVVMHVDQVQHDNLADGDLQRTQKLRPTTVYPLPDVYSDGFRKVAASLTALADEQPTLFDESDDVGLPQDLIDRLNRDELDARDEDGRRDWAAADEQKLAEIREAIADGDWHPARQFGRGYLDDLHRLGEVEVEPEWWLTGGPSGMDKVQEADVIPHVRLVAVDEQPEPSTAAAVDDLLADAEVHQPIVILIQGADGAWVVRMPEGHEDRAPAGGPWMLAQAAMQAVDRVIAIKEWRADGTHGWSGVIDVDAAGHDEDVPF